MAGRHVFMGYLNKEDKTSETIDKEGWLHSGDIGRVDEVTTGRLFAAILSIDIWTDKAAVKVLINNEFLPVDNRKCMSKSEEYLGVCQLLQTR